MSRNAVLHEAGSVSLDIAHAILNNSITQLYSLQSTFSAIVQSCFATPLKAGLLETISSIKDMLVSARTTCYIPLICMRITATTNFLLVSYILTRCSEPVLSSRSLLLSRTQQPIMSYLGPSGGLDTVELANNCWLANTSFRQPIWVTWSVHPKRAQSNASEIYTTSVLHYPASWRPPHHGNVRPSPLEVRTVDLNWGHNASKGQAPANAKGYGSPSTQTQTLICLCFESFCWEKENSAAIWWQNWVSASQEGSAARWQNWVLLLPSCRSMYCCHQLLGELKELWAIRYTTLAKKE